MACDNCRLKKVKCDATRPPCQRCKDRGVTCVYRKRMRRYSKEVGPTALEARVIQLESLIQSLQKDTRGKSPVDASASTASPQMVQAVSATQEQLHYSEEPAWSSIYTPPPYVNTPKDHDIQACVPSPHYDEQTKTVDSILWNLDDMDDILEDKRSFLMTGHNGQEFIGSSSSMCLFSDLGVQWISQSTDNSKSLDVLHELVSKIMSKLKMPDPEICNKIPADRLRVPLPGVDTARNYVEGAAYFDRAQCIWPILDRTCFTSDCERFWADPSFADTPFYALYNMVLAIGCGSYLPSSSPMSFRQSERTASAFFQNAFSVQAELMQQRTTLRTIQAFGLMLLLIRAFFSDRIGGRTPGYLFITMAVRLEQGLGMHRRPLKAWNLSSVEIEERNRVFWALYCVDKIFAFHSGRPSIIDDDDITCAFPRHVFEKGRHGHTPPKESFDLFLSIARYARHCTKITRQLYSAPSLVQRPKQIINTIFKLYDELKQWWSLVPTASGDFELDNLTYSPDASTGIDLTQHVILRTWFYSSLFALYRACREPGFVLLEKTAQSMTADETMKFKQIAADGLEAARSMCVLIQQIKIESQTPVWLIVYYPIMAVFILFINVVVEPLATTATNDIAIMEIVTGIFGRLEFITSGETALTRIGEFARIARAALEKARSAQSDEIRALDDDFLSAGLPNLDLSMFAHEIGLGAIYLEKVRQINERTNVFAERAGTVFECRSLYISKG